MPLKQETVDAFSSLPEDRQRKALSGMSDEAKQALLDGIKSRKTQDKPPGVPKPDAILNPRTAQEKEAAATYGNKAFSGNPFESTIEMGKQLAKTGKGVKELFTKELPEIAKNPIAALPSLALGVKQQADEATGDTSTLGGKARYAGNVLDVLAGGDPVEAKKNEAQGNEEAAFVDRFGIPLAAHGINKLLPKLPGLTRETDTTAYEPQKTSIANMAGGKIRSEASRTPGNIFSRVTDPIRQAARDVGSKESEMKADFPGKEVPLTEPKVWYRKLAQRFTEGKPKEQADLLVQKGNKRVMDILDRAVGNQDTKFESIIGQYRSAPIYSGADSTVSRIRNAATQYENLVSKELGDELNSFANRLEGKGKTIGDADAIRKELNKKADKIYARREMAPEMDLQRADAYRRSADIIRGDLYDDLSKISGVPKEEIRDMQRLHGDLISYRDAVTDEMLGLQPEETAGREAGPIRRVIGGRSEESSVSIGKMVKRAVGPTAHGKINMSMRRALKNVGEGGSNESYKPVSRRRLPQLPSGDIEVPTSLQRIIGGHPTGALAPNRISPNNFEVISNPSPEGYEYTKPFITDYEGSGAQGEPKIVPDSTMQGSNRGVVKVSDGPSAQRMLDSMDNVPDSELQGLDSTERAKWDELKQQLRKKAQEGAKGKPELPSLKKTEGTPPTRRRLKALPKIAGRTLPTLAATQRDNDSQQ